MKKIFITGGAGYVGAVLVPHLLNKGYTVTVLDLMIYGDEVLPTNPNLNAVKSDIRNQVLLEKLIPGHDAVIHLAAYQDYLPDFSRFFHVNSVGTALLYELIVERRYPIHKIVIASSQAVYGEGPYNCPDHGRIWPDGRTLEQLEHGQWDILCPSCDAPLHPVPADEEGVNPGNSYAISKHTQEPSWNEFVTF